MIRKSFGIMALVLCLGLVMTGCPKKAVTKGVPSSLQTEAAAAERERAARLEAERAQKERELQAEKERAKLEAQRELEEKERRIKEEETRRIQVEKELEAERERTARLEAERAQKEKELEAERQLRERELEAKEAEAKRMQAKKELEAERERAARLALREKELKAKEEEAKRALAEKQRAFEESLVAKKYPGMDGEVFESSQFKDIYFDFDSYDIGGGQTDNLNQNAALLKERPALKVQIEGHCDERGTLEYNLALGERRATTAKKYLISLGIPGDRISTISYGKERPVDSSHNEQAWARNRRAHFIIISK